MSLNKVLIAEIQQEAENTRKLLRTVPTEHLEWQPHEKSMTVTRLATHIAELPGWTAMVLTTTEMDLAKREYKPTYAQTNEELLEKFEKHNNMAIEALKDATDEQLTNETWTLRNGEKVMFSLPKAAVIRSFSMNHLYHHRGQLSVFLRLLNVPIPGMYGPSKDDDLMMAAAKIAEQN